MVREKPKRTKPTVAGRQDAQSLRPGRPVVRRRRQRQVNIFPTFVPILLFSGALLWVATEGDTHPVVPMAFSLALGFMLAFLAPRHRVLTGSLPAIGTFALLLLVQVGGGNVPFNDIALVWAPISLTAIIGALLGSRLSRK